MINVQVFENAGQLARAAADHIVTQAAAAITARDRFSLGLSGGSTPRALLTLLASDDYAHRLDWSRIHVFWGDERCVPPDHPESNFRMAREALLDHVPIPSTHIHRMRGEIAPAHAAADYEADLRRFFTTTDSASNVGDDVPRFDLLLQGMGEDGHTASLFPGTAALNEVGRWVTENFVPRLEAWRITLTVPAINAARQVIFLVTGAAKAETLAEVLHGDYQPEVYPAQLVRPVDGELIWMVDEAAAAHI